jgi:hypothetical protein
LRNVRVGLDANRGDRIGRRLNRRPSLDHLLAGYGTQDIGNRRLAVCTGGDRARRLDTRSRWWNEEDFDVGNRSATRVSDSCDQRRVEGLSHNLSRTSVADDRDPGGLPVLREDQILSPTGSNTEREGDDEDR